MLAPARQLHVRKLHPAPGEVLLQVEIKPDQSEDDAYGLAALARVLDRPGIHNVLVDEVRVPELERVQGQLVEEFLFRGHGGHTMSLPQLQSALDPAGRLVELAVGNWLSLSEEDTMAVSTMAGIPALKDLNADLRRRMDQAVATFQSSLASTRTGRASAHMLDQVKVDYYGTLTPITQLAQVSTPEAQTILISPYDPNVLKEMEKAIRASDLGFNPLSDGKILRVPVPPMTEERRRDVVKHLHKVLEEHRTAVRNVRRDGNDALKKLAKDKKISEDEEKRAIEEVQKMTDEEIRKMEEMSRRKEVEVMQV